MNDSDKVEFKKLMDDLADYYGKDRLDKSVLQIYYSAFINFKVEDVSRAASRHIADQEVGRFFPKVPDLIGYLSGRKITADMIIAAAKLHKTPLGILARIHIGTWDLDNTDGFYLRQRAEECLQLLPEWRRRAVGGDYTDHEISMMMKHGVQVNAPFFEGTLLNDNSAGLLKRAEAISKTSRHQFLLEKPFSAEESKKKH